MSQTTVYQALPAGVIGFAEKHPDILDLFATWVETIPWLHMPPRPILRDLRQLLHYAEDDASILGDYGRLSLPTLRAFVASPHKAVLPTLVPSLTIDKAGPGIHFLLTGTTEGGGKPPLRDLIYGGKELPVVPRGPFWVPDRLLTPPQVLEIAQALAAVDVGDLEARYDPVRMSGLRIYPHVWTEDDEAPDWLLKHYDALAAYVQQAAGHRNALVISTTL